MFRALNKSLFFSSLKQDGKTPIDLYEKLDKEFHFDFDPCPPDADFNGLEIDWKKSNFVNPPFNQQKLWVKKAYEQMLKAQIFEKQYQSILLLPARTDTKIFHEIILPFAKEIRFIQGRLKFQQYKNSAPFPSMIVIFTQIPAQGGWCVSYNAL